MDTFLGFQVVKESGETFQRAAICSATADFERSIRKKDGFADAYAGAAGTLAWLAVFHRDDMDALKRIVQRSHDSWQKALELT